MGFWPLEQHRCGHFLKKNRAAAGGVLREREREREKDRPYNRVWLACFPNIHIELARELLHKRLLGAGEFRHFTSMGYKRSWGKSVNLNFFKGDGIALYTP